jgi:prevent-host-death family protein
MSTITLQEAQANLADVIHRLTPGQVVTITENEQPIARIVPLLTDGQPAPPVVNPNWLGYPHPGSCEGLFVVPDDFKEPLEELREYME